MTKRTRSNTQETIDPVQDQVDHVVDTIQVSILQRSATLLEESIQNSRSSAVIARRRIQETYSPSTSPSVKKNKKQSEFLVAEHFLEKDRILTSESELSVGTRIKRACLKLYGKYDSLDKQEKTLVELGANSILDLTKHNSSHKKMFTNLEWKYLIKEFTSNFQDYELDADIEAKVSEIDKVNCLENAIDR
ncbi:hypothetical protein BDF14DRAFT_312745 [Spinellus fusiger]|nr:hypothetical protein BDF14DRAFT_312745 [Spinellus fusiger]